MVIVVMGVAGSGKTTVGRLLASKLHWRFADADEFHPPANIAKMAAGHPLDDRDRAPWLEAMRAYIDERLARNENAVVTCSALKKVYRTALGADRPSIKLVHLHGSPELIRSRVAHRVGHFMGAAMVDSQFATLEIPDGALSLDVTPAPEILVQKIRDAFGLQDGISKVSNA